MIHFQQSVISSTLVKGALLYELYAEDMDLVKKYHAVGGEDATVELCAAKTLNTIESQEGVKFIRVMQKSNCFTRSCLKKNTVGYFTDQYLDDKRFVMSFFVRPEFRTKVMLDIFWNTVLLGGPFYTSVSEKNTRAIEHFKRNGFQEISSGEFDGLNWIMYYKK